MSVNNYFSVAQMAGDGQMKYEPITLHIPHPEKKQMEGTILSCSHFQLSWLKIIQADKRPFTSYPLV